ncbi:MAG: hypothetical protein ACHQLQ_03985 [Candidatus Acidiferrales bacterium]
MARPRSKPDFTAGVVLTDEARQCRALELRVRSDNLYAMQPRRGKAAKSSYHSSGEFHFKVGNSAPITPTVELPPRFVKERAFPLGQERRCLFAISLENAPALLQFTGQPYDHRIDLKLPKVDGLFVMELYLGNTSGQRLVFETEGYAEATIAEHSFAGAGYDFCLRLAVVSSRPVCRRMLDERISAAWLNAAADLGIRVVAPFPVMVSTGESLLYEAHIVDFGGPKGMVVGLPDRDHIGDVRRSHGYGSSDLFPVYRQYNRDLFIDTLNDWQWFGQKGEQPSWYTGKKWAG